MGYAFEGVPYHELPDQEKLSWWLMDAQIRDSFLNLEEFRVKYLVTKEHKDRFSTKKSLQENFEFPLEGIIDHPVE